MGNQRDSVPILWIMQEVKEQTMKTSNVRCTMYINPNVHKINLISEMIFQLICFLIFFL